MNEPAPDMFRQHRACSDCPFRREGGVRHGRSARDYIRYFSTGSRVSFPCHNSVRHDADRQQWGAWEPGQSICAGGLIFAEKTGQCSNLMLLGIASGRYRPERLQDIGAVFDTREEMIVAHETEKP